MSRRSQTSGVMFDRSQWRPPQLVAKSDKQARPDQDNPFDASEFLDDEETLALKVQAVANLLRAAKHCVCYTGAGISKSSGIPDYATRAVGSVVASTKRLRNPLDAQPTPAHDALASLYRAGFVKEFVNQNHDALFEKAGVKPIHSNLIHGDWFDVSNPVVQFSQSLRSDLFHRLLQSERSADLVLVAGTSLSGMNADRVAHTCAERYRKNQGGVLGSVIVNLQRTKLDDDAVVRVWCKTDDFFAKLAAEMGVPVEHVRPEGLESNIFEVPYTRDGKKLRSDSGTRRLILDLSPGAQVQIVHPDASNKGKIYTVSPERDIDGNWLFDLRRPGKLSIQERLGRWYIMAAVSGELDQLPVVNLNPEYTQSRGKEDEVEMKAD